MLSVNTHFLSDTRGIDTELKEHIVILLPTVISFEPQKATENLKKHVSATRKQWLLIDW